MFAAVLFKIFRLSSAVDRFRDLNIRKPLIFTVILFETRFLRYGKFRGQFSGVSRKKRRRKERNNFCSTPHNYNDQVKVDEMNRVCNTHE
jgi:hypothetical protein